MSRTPPHGTLPVPVVRRDLETPSPGESLVAYSNPAPSDLRRRVARLLFLRTFVVTVVLTLSIWLLTSRGDPVGSVVWLQSGLIALTYLSSIIFGVLLRIGRPPRAVARPMWAVDVAVTSAFVYITGGVQSPYTFLYALTIVSAGALSYRRGAVVVTVGAVTSITIVSLLAFWRVFDLPQAGSVKPWDQSTLDFVRTLGIQVAAQLGVGALAFIFGDQLQRGAETLATTRKEAADLFTVHQSIVRSLASGLITIAPDGTVLTANQAAADILRRSVPEIVRHSLDDVMPGLLALITESRGELRRADLQLGELTVGVTVSLLRDLDDVVIGRVVNFTDLTELRRLELTTRRAERLASVGELAAGVAHEIRNPLAAISGSIELLRAVPQANEDDRALMNIVSREIQRLNVLIGDLLDYANPRPIQRVDFDLGVMVRETVQVARADQTFAAVELACEVDAPLPIAADAGKLRQVLWNLVRNAAESGGRHVRLEARGERRVATIVVEDDGPGIEESALARIFDPFFTTKKHGTGLGLAQCHAIIAEHGGRLDVESAVGKGTKMMVSLPRTALPSRS